jgi:catechol 2,3-dioxygenase-like lactoylglutathione lyase family enzyme
VRIHLTSVYVDDQDRALAFYTELLGFELQENFPVGEYRWLTLTAPGDAGGTQLLLEPDAHPAVGPFKAALVADGIPFTSFAVDDVNVEHERLSSLGVHFTQEPTDLGPATSAVLDDTCGNLIGIVHRNS